MIGFLRGKLLHKQPPFLLVDVGGVGYELEAPMSTFYVLPDELAEVALYAHLVVRQDAQLLYGFSDQEQRQLFRSLLRINGVGARVALAILSTFSAREFIQCIHNEDAAVLTRVPGVGKKTAERMIIDMRDRIDAATDSGDAARDAESNRARGDDAADNPVQDAIGALIALGYKASEAHRMVSAVKQPEAQREELIRNALQQLSKR